MHKTGEYFPTILIFALLAVSCIAAAPAMAAPQIADFSADPTSGVAPLTVQFTDESVDNATSWAWSFGDEDTSTDQNPVHTYDTAGTYSVTLNVTVDGVPFEVSKVDYITVNEPPLPPTADFFADKTSGDAPLEVQFTDTSYDSPTSWSWSFGDGDTSGDQSPVHTYATAGTYSVNLMVSNEDGFDEEFKVDYITVNEPPLPPTADFFADKTSGDAPLEVQFTDNSYDNPTSWSWTFGDGETSTEQNPIHTYTTAGIYSVNLTVMNNGGSDDELKSDYINVTSPVAAAGIVYQSYNITESYRKPNISLPMPSGVAQNDLLLAQITYNVGNVVSTTGPSDWTLLIRTNNGPNPWDGQHIGQAIYYKVANASESGPYVWNISWGPVGSYSQSAMGGIMRFSGVDPISPIFGYSGGIGNSSNLTAPGINGVPANSMLVAYFGLDGSLSSFAVPSNMTWIYQDVFNAGTVGPSFAAAWELYGPGGNTGARFSSNSFSGAPWVAHLVALSPAVCIQSMNITKTANTTGPVVPGQVVMYNVTVCNKGTEPLTAVKVIDNRTGQHDISGSINPGECKNASWLYTVTDQDARNGTIVNVAYANATACGSSFEIHDNPNATMTLPVKVNPDRIGVFLNGGWWLDANGNGVWEDGNDTLKVFGSPGCQAVVGDWSGNGTDEIGVFLNGGWWLDANGNGVWEDGNDTLKVFGSPGCQAVVGDWDGNGTDEIGVFLNGGWWLDTNGNGVWDDGIDTLIVFGSPGCQAVVGEWNGDGTDEIGVFLNGGWWLDADGNGVWEDAADTLKVFGSPGCQAVVGNFG